MLNRIFQRTERGRIVLLEDRDLPLSDMRLLMRFNGYTPLGLLLDPHDDEDRLSGAVARLQQAGLIEPIGGANDADATAPARPAASWAERVTHLTLQACAS